MPDAYSLIALLIMVCFLSSCMMVGLIGTATPIVLIFSRGKQLRQKVAVAWEPLARSTGLVLDSFGPLKIPLLSGQYRGRALTLSYGSTGSTSDCTTIRIDTTIPDVRYLGIRRPGAIDAILKPLAINVARTGDEEFDRQIRISIYPPEAAVRLLANNPAARGILVSLNPGGFDLVYHYQRLSYREVGVITDPERLEKLFGLLSDLVDQLGGK